MGCCSSTPQPPVEAPPPPQPAKFLLLGTGTSGKTTIFKQLKLACGNFSTQERLTFAPQIKEEIIASMQTLIKIAVGPLGRTFNAAEIAAAERINALEPTLAVELTSAVANDLTTLWGSPGSAVRVAHTQRRKVQELVEHGDVNRELCVDNFHIFMRDINAIAAPGYEPTNEHIVSVRTKTTGVTEAPLALEGDEITLVDVGGQRSERRKWVNVFEGVNVVLYVISLSDYDQTLSEEISINRMHESLEIFEKMSNHVVFENAIFIVFLNKFDVLQQKLAADPPSYPSEVFPDYQPADAQATAVFLKGKFIEKMKNARENDNVFFHFTNATQPTDVTNVLRSAIKTHKARRAK
jgi:guanine nucleotide-binding protein subunit alpha